jgi:ribosomal-protein-alanine N-acetyltransferase
MILETSRTILRPFIKKDLYYLHDYAKVEGIGEMAGWTHHKSLYKTKRLLKDNIKNPNMFAIELKQNSMVIGHIAINEDPEDKLETTKELGFALHPYYHNLGIMSEVVNRVLTHLFLMNTEAVYACCFLDNPASKRLIEKCGFVFEKEGSFYFEAKKKTLKTYDYVHTLDSWSNSRAL